MKNLLQNQFFRVSELKILILCFLLLYTTVGYTAELTKSEFEADVTITGRVIDETGEGIPGVTVLIEGHGSGTVTDIDGTYTINAPEDAQLTFSYVGFESQTVAIGNQSEINITLIMDTASLDEVVVIGYGTARKRDLTGAVSSVTASKLENENPNSIQDVLRGNIAGLNVGLSTSAKGGGSLEVRGRTSLNAGSSPL